jgi:hypothetical protein
MKKMFSYDEWKPIIKRKALGLEPALPIPFKWNLDVIEIERLFENILHQLCII